MYAPVPPMPRELTPPGGLDSRKNERRRTVKQSDEIQDPRNDEDYDTFEYGTEPLPHDETWAHCGKCGDCRYSATASG